MDPVGTDVVFAAVRDALEAREYAKWQPRPAVATAQAVRAVEEEIGCSLPPLLRRLFLEVANGGFGPGHGGIPGVPGFDGWTSNGNWKDLLEVHRAFRGGPDPHAPRHTLWLYEWGCCIWSLVDCSHPEGRDVGLGRQCIKPA